MAEGALNRQPLTSVCRLLTSDLRHLSSGILSSLARRSDFLRSRLPSVFCRSIFHVFCLLYSAYYLLDHSILPVTDDWSLFTDDWFHAVVRRLLAPLNSREPRDHSTGVLCPLSSCCLLSSLF